VIGLAGWLGAAGLSAAQERAAARQGDTRPPADNDRTLREITPEEIPPNLNFYAVDPLYDPEANLGWAAERIEEDLNRGLVAAPQGDGGVYLGWRLLRDDPRGVGFNVYRAVPAADPVKLNAAPVLRTTDFVDPGPLPEGDCAWFVRPVADGREGPDSGPAMVLEPGGYHAIPLRADVDGAAMVGIGDLDGDRVYDVVVKHPGRGGKDPGRMQPSAGTYKYDAYSGRTGEFLWRIDLGWNVDMGIWWTPMVVRDLDGDGRAEVCVRTSDFAATREEMHPSGEGGSVLGAPEYLAVYDGGNGALIDRVPWIELGTVQEWGDNTGNRASRHMMAVAYLDGKTPAVLAVRGTYGLMKVDAWVLENRKLRKVWRWTNERAPFLYHGQGQHSVKTGDIDGDGNDEIINGSLAIDHDGRTLWGTGLGHGDRAYLGDLLPDRPGWEIFYTIEEPHPRNGACLVDARTGAILWGAEEPTDDNELGSALAADIDPALPGTEFAAGRFSFDAQGRRLDSPVPPQGLLAWWDADSLREFVTRGGLGKWDGARVVPLDDVSIDGPVLQVADILGDWREELVTAVNGELRIYTTTIPAADRRACLMQDPLYRNDVCHNTMGYTNRHSPMVSYALGMEGAAEE
jgi:hypothetical protein